jgi:SAM-dependent methyltransferase
VSGIDDARRTSFGSVAQQYDASRPSYPTSMVDEVLGYAGASAGDRAVEVGAGTGIATALFVARGLVIDAIEPSAEMAAVARARPETAGVRFQICKFEDAVLPSHEFQLVYSATAWHWVEPLEGEKLAARALVPGGALACFWNPVAWDKCTLRDALRRAYASAGWEPDGQMSPDRGQIDFAPSWHERIDATPELGEARTSVFEWSIRYTAPEYVTLILTHSDHIMLPNEQRARVSEAVSSVIDADGGGEIEIVYATQLGLARAL